MATSLGSVDDGQQSFLRLDSESQEVQLWHDSWTRARYYAVRRAPYYAPYILRLRPEFVPNAGQMTIRKDWRCVIDPTLIEEDYLWKLLVYWSHHLYQDHLGRRTERHPELWAIACQLATVDAWEGVMTREDTEAEYPGFGLPPGLFGAADFGLEPGMSVEEYYQVLYDNATVVPIPAMGEGAQSPEAGSGGHGAPQAGQDSASGAPGAPTSGQADPSSVGGAPRPGPEQPGQGLRAGGTDKGANSPSPDQQAPAGNGQGPQQDPQHNPASPGGSTSPSAEQDPAESAAKRPEPAGADGPDVSDSTRPNPIDLENSEAPQEDREVEVMHESANQIAKATPGGLSAGNAPGDMLRELADKPGYRAPIERRLARLVTRKKGNQDWQTSHRPSTRDLNHPDGVISVTLTKGLPEVVFLIDTSGSMSEEMLAGSLEIAERVCRSATIRIATGDVIVQDLERKDLTRAGVRRLAARGLRGGGGTNMVRCVTEVARHAPGLPILVFTDGIFNWPQSKEDLRGAKVMWLVIQHPHYPPPVPDWCQKDVVEVTHAELAARMGIAV